MITMEHRIQAKLSLHRVFVVRNGVRAVHRRHYAFDCLACRVREKIPLDHAAVGVLISVGGRVVSATSWRCNGAELDDEKASAGRCLSKSRKTCKGLTTNPYRKRR